MKKILITEAQLRMLENEGWSYSPEKIDEFVEAAGKDLTDAKKVLAGARNAITFVTLGEMMDDIARYESFVSEVEQYQKHYEKLYGKYYDIVDMYDYMDLPDNVNKLEKINDQIDAVQNDLYRVYNSMEEIVENVKKLKEINETSGDN
jgi:uncharacterized protein Yka (UPF0111/DUF47 family)